MSNANNDIHIRQEKIAYIRKLIVRYALKEPMTDVELADLQQWQTLSCEHAAFPDRFSDAYWVGQRLVRMRQLDKARAWDALVERIEAAEAKAITLRQRLRHLGYAAATILLCGTLIWTVVKHFTPLERLSPIAEKATVKELDKFAALLTVNDGRHIILDSLRGTTLSSAGGLQTAMQDSNVLLYTMPAGKSGKPITHTVQTRRMKTFDLIFPDKSQISLGHASKLNYVFNSRGRIMDVTLSGHAWFDIAPHAGEPFILKVNGIRVEVLGTAFDVMGYPDDSITQVTLLHGKIRVSNGVSSKTLDRSAQLRVTARNITLHEVRHPDSVKAWMGNDPAFSFRDADLATVMRTLARWYEFRVSSTPQAQVKSIPVRATFPLSMPVDTVLHLLEKVESDHVHFYRRNNVVTIVPGK